MTENLQRVAQKLQQHREKDVGLQDEIRYLLLHEPNKALAEELEVSQAFLCDVRKGRRAVTDGLVEKLARARWKKAKGKTS